MESEFGKTIVPGQIIVIEPTFLRISPLPPLGGDIMFGDNRARRVPVAQLQGNANPPISVTAPTLVPLTLLSGANRAVFIARPK